MVNPMNYDITLEAATAEHHQAKVPRAHEMDSILAQQVKAGELLDCLVAVILGSYTAQKALQDTPELLPDLLRYLNEQALESYRALMRAVAFS
jgi:hypothetical protein